MPVVCFLLGVCVRGGRGREEAQEVRWRAAWDAVVVPSVGRLLCDAFSGPPAEFRARFTRFRVASIPAALLALLVV